MDAIHNKGYDKGNKGKGRGCGGNGRGRPDGHAAPDGKGRGRGGSKGRGKGARSDVSRASSVGPSASQVGPSFSGTCHRCGKYGHRARDCPSNVNQLAQSDEVMSAAGSASDSKVLTVKRVLSLTSQSQTLALGGVQELQLSPVVQSNSDWVLCLVDSGAYNHVAPPEFAPGWPTRPLTGTSRKVVTADGTVMPHLGLKTVVVVLQDHGRAKVDFELLQGLKGPIMSVSKLAENGWTVSFQPANKARLSDGHSVIPLVKCGDMWYLRLRVLRGPGEEGGVHFRTLDESAATLAPVSRRAPAQAEAAAGPGKPTEAAAPRPAAAAEGPAEDALMAPAGGPAGGEAADEAVEPAAPARGGPVPPEPCERERRERRLTHLPYRPWCESCVAAKGRDAPRRRRSAHLDAPEVQLDFTFARTSDVEDQLQTILVGVHVQSGYGFGALVPSKEVKKDKLLLSHVLDFLREAGLLGVELVVHTDGEPAMCLLADQVALARGEARTVVVHGAPNSPQSQGSVERYGQSFKGPRARC